MTQPSDPDDRLREGDAPLATPFGHPVTPNEVHAVVIGLSGVFTGAAWALGSIDAAIGLTSILVGYALLGRPILRSLPHDHPDYGRARPRLTMALRTIKREPWWFLGSYTLWAVATAAILGVLA